MARTLNLKQLLGLFAKSAGKDELTLSERQFAAQLAVLTAHVDHMTAKLKALDAIVAELAQHVVAMQQPSAPAQSAAESIDEDPEETEAKALAAKLQAETAAEAAAIAAKQPAVTPIRQPDAQAS